MQRYTLYGNPLPGVDGTYVLYSEAMVEIEKLNKKISIIEERLVVTETSAAKEIAELTAHIDLMLDEFVRIAACPGVTDEIRGLCIRGQQGIEQSVPVIIQRNNALKKIDLLEGELELSKQEVYTKDQKIAILLRISLLS